MELITQALVQTALPVRPAQAHKGNFGRVLVIAGSRSMCGAGLLCAKSALMAGAGLVYWALPASMQPAFAAAFPEGITIPLPETDQGEISASAWELFPAICQKYHPSLMVVGPGMGNSPILPFLLANSALPLVVDADALNALAQQTAWHVHWPTDRPAIFTPHAMEMARLLGEAVSTDETSREDQISKLVSLTKSVCLLKGAHTLVGAQIDGRNKIYQNTTGTVALAKGGSGDVLSGLLAGLWAQLGMAEGFSTSTALKATICGVYLHGLAGELAAQSKGNYSVLASDTLANLPQALLRTGEKK